MMNREEMIFNKKTWEIVGKGFFVQDCTIGFEDGRIGFLFVEHNEHSHIDDGWETRLVAIRLNAPLETNYYVRKGGNMTHSSIASAWVPRQTEFVMADSFRRVWAYKPKTYKGSESNIPFDSGGHDFNATITKTVRVGSTVYAIGGPLRIFERLNGQQWKEITDIPIPAPFTGTDRKKLIEAVGQSFFFDLAGVSENDMYAVGDAGIVWHFDGKTWAQRAFPSDVRLATVTCSPHGDVYITDLRGTLWKGNGNNWQVVCSVPLSIPFEDSAWFDGTLWCANDYGMYVLEGNELVQAHMSKQHPVPTDVAYHSHRIDVSPDGTTMLVCGRDGAAMLDANGWTILFSGMDLEDS